MDLTFGDAPDHNAAEFQLLAGCWIGRDPAVADGDFVVLGDDVFDLHVQVGGIFLAHRPVPKACLAER